MASTPVIDPELGAEKVKTVELEPSVRIAPAAIDHVE